MHVLSGTTSVGDQGGEVENVMGVSKQVVRPRADAILPFGNPPSLFSTDVTTIMYSLAEGASAMLIKMAYRD